MEDNIFSPMEIDAIGEIMNISLGSSATAVSNMLDHRVDITTPQVAVMDGSEFTLGDLEPAIGVEIRYISGLEGSNIMLLKRSDVKVIVDILMGTETPEEEFELNELTVSAVCEVMNQMMGAASTALSDFLGRLVNISTPESFELENFDQFKQDHFPTESGKVVVVRFTLSIEGTLRSEFVNIMSVKLARELIASFELDGGDETVDQVQKSQPASEPAASGGKLTQEEIERLMQAETPEMPQAEPEPTAASEPASAGGKLSQEEIERLMQSVAGESSPAPQTEPAPGAQQAGPARGSQPPEGPMQQPHLPGGQGGYPQQPPYYGQPVPGYYPPAPGYYYPPEPSREPPAPKVIHTQPAEMPHLEGKSQLGEEQAQNLDLILSVPLEVSVEIGRTRKKIQDILTFSKGSLVVLDKLAGDQVDLFVNGQCIAKGDVVVIDDNFGIRITEIVKTPNPGELVQ